MIWAATPLGAKQDIVPFKAKSSPPQRYKEILPFEIPMDSPYT